MSNKLILQLLIASAFIGTHLNAITETVYNLSSGKVYVTNANLMHKGLLNINDTISQPNVSTIYISSGNIYNNNKLSLQGNAYLQISGKPGTKSIQIDEYDSSGNFFSTNQYTDTANLYIYSSSTPSGLVVVPSETLTNSDTGIIVATSKPIVATPKPISGTTLTNNATNTKN